MTDHVELHNYFQCASCGGTFKKAWSEAEAIAEREREFPGVPQSECEVICRDCYVKFDAWRKAKAS